MLARELKRAAELPAEDLMRRQAGDVLVVQEDAPGIRLKEAGDNIEQGRLASAVGADQAGDRAFPHLDRAVVDGAQATEILYQTLHLKQGLAASRLGTLHAQRLFHRKIGRAHV